VKITSKNCNSRRRANGARLLSIATVILLLAAAAAAAAAGQSGTRVVHLEVWAAKDAPPLRISVRENETLITEIKDAGTFGFEVKFRDRRASTVLLVIFDAETSPHVLLGAVEVPVNGKRVESNTSPSFGLRIVRIVESR
jgi:hypothetical protein